MLTVYRAMFRSVQSYSVYFFFWPARSPVKQERPRLS